MTPALVCSGLLVGAVAFTDIIAKQLGEDMYKAIHHACQSPKGIAIDLDVPLNKLYDQLNGNAPFTYLWRILAAFPDVKLEFYALQAARVDAAFVRAGELRELVGGVRTLLAQLPKRMAKASLPVRGRKVQAV